MFEAIKYFITSQYITNTSPINGIGQFCYEIVINFFKLIKYVPDIISLLPWYVTEIIVIVFAIKVVPGLINFVCWLIEKWEDLSDKLTRGKFKL